MSEPDSENVGGHDDTEEEMVEEKVEKSEECVSEEEVKIKYVIKVNTDKKQVDKQISVGEELERRTEQHIDVEENQQRGKKKELKLSDSALIHLIDKLKDDGDSELCSQQSEDSHQDSDLDIDQEIPQSYSDMEEKSLISTRKVVMSKGPLHLEREKLSSITSRKDKRSAAPNITDCTESPVISSEESKTNLDHSMEEGCSLSSPKNVSGKRPLSPSVVNSSCDESSKKSGSPSSEEAEKSVAPYGKETRMPVEPSSEESEEQPDVYSEERTHAALDTEDTQEERDVDNSSVHGSVESCHDKTDQPAANSEQELECIPNDHTANSSQRETKVLKGALMLSEVPEENTEKHVNDNAPDVENPVNRGCREVECLDVSSGNEDSFVSHDETSEVICLSMKSKETIIPTVCKNCQSIWNDRVLRAIFLGTESVTVNSKITYGAIISINNWAESHFKSNKESAVRGLLERADLGKNIGSLKISEVNNWLGSHLKAGHIKCCDEFVAVYKENPKDEPLSSLIASSASMAETPTGNKKRIAVVTLDDAPAAKKVMKEHPKAESNQISKQAVVGSLSLPKEHPSQGSSNDSDSCSQKESQDDMQDIPLVAKQTDTPCSQTNKATKTEHKTKKDQTSVSLKTSSKQTLQNVSEESKLPNSEECTSVVSEESALPDKDSLLPPEETSIPVTEKPAQHEENDDSPSLCKTASSSPLEEKSAVSNMSSSEVPQEEKSPTDMEDLLLNQEEHEKEEHESIPSEAVVLSSSTVSLDATGTSPSTMSGSLETESTDPSKLAFMPLSGSSASESKPLSPSASSLDGHSEGTYSTSDEMKAVVPEARDLKQSESEEDSMEISDKQTELASATSEKQPIVQDGSDPSCMKFSHQSSETSHDSPRDSPIPSNEATQPNMEAVDQPTSHAESPCNSPASCGLEVMSEESKTSEQMAEVESVSGTSTTYASAVDSESKLETETPEFPDPIFPATPSPAMSTDSIEQEPMEQHSLDESLIQEQSILEQQASDEEQPHLQLQESVRELYLSDSDGGDEDENKVPVETEDISSVNLCMTLGLDVSTLDTYCSINDAKTITNGVMMKNPLERYKYSFSHYAVLKEQSALSGFAREAFDLLPFESDNCRPLVLGNKGRERFLTNRELLTLQNICILNAESPDVDLFYRILVQILLTRNRVLLVPNSRTLLLVAEKLRRNFNRAKSKGAYAEFLSQDWDPSSIFTAEDLWLVKHEQPKEPTVRNILSVFCLWKNLDKNIPGLSLSDALSNICRNINFDNTNNIGMCIKLYARFCHFLYEEKNNSLAEFFLDQPFIGSETPTSKKVLVDFMAAKFSMDVTNLSSARSLNIAEKEVHGAVQKCLSAEKAVLHSPDARKEEDFRLSIALLKEKVNRYKEVNNLLVHKIRDTEKRKQEVLKRVTDSKTKKLIQELNETLTAIHHTLDKQNADSSTERTECNKKSLKLDNSTDIQSCSEAYSKCILGEDVPQGVQEVIYELLTNEVDVNQIRPLIHMIMNKVAGEEVPGLPSITWIRNFARFNGFKMNTN